AWCLQATTSSAIRACLATSGTFVHNRGECILWTKQHWPRSYAARDSSAPTRGLDLWRNRPNAVRRGGQAPFARTFRRRGPSLLRPAVPALRHTRPASHGADGADGNPAARVTTTGRGRCARNISHSVLLLISAPDLDSGALSVSEMASPRAPHTRSEWSL